MALDRIIDRPRRSLRRLKPSSIALADGARDAGQWERAVQLYRKALDRNPRNAPIWVQYGHALKESGELRDPDKLVQAEIAYRRAITLDPSAADPHLQLGHALKLQGKTEEAQAAYLRAFVLDPSMPYPLRELSRLGWSEAHLSELRGMRENAVPLFSERAVPTAHDDPSPPGDPAGLLISNGTTQQLNHVVSQGDSTSTSPAAAKPWYADSDVVMRTIEAEFDVQFYLTKYPDVRAAQIDPLWHFVDTGWKECRDPNTSFSTEYYLTCNRDVRNSGINPLLHYITSGRAEGRLPSSARGYRGYDIPYDIGDRNPVLSLPVQIGRDKRTYSPDARTRIAVHIHVFYLDCLLQILNYVNVIPEPFHLYISTDEPSKVAEIKRMLEDSPAGSQTEVRLCPNRGRDIAPFLLVFSDVFGNFEYWLHLHTKKSIDKPGLGPRWLTHNLNNLLHDSRYIRAILALFDQELRCGMVIPTPPDEIRSFMDWGKNYDVATRCLKTLNIDADVLDAFPLSFPAGNMFWCRSSALERIFRSARLSFSDFPEEPIPDDGTLAHAFERLLPYVVHHDGFHHRIVEPLPAHRMPGPRTDFVLTVVIPAYNAANWLHHSVQSVITQELTTSPVEIIVVDNQSTDETAEICRFYSQSFGHIRYFTESTRGAGAARNLGIRKARGKYICFLDADDMLALDGLEQLLGLAIDTNADLVTSPLCRFTESQISHPDPEFAGALVSLGEIVRGEKVPLHGSRERMDVEAIFGDFGPCAKLYKMGLLRGNDIEFPIETNYEDNLFVYRSYLKAEVIAVYPRPTYFYRKYSEYAGTTQSTILSGHAIGDQIRVLHQVLDLIEPRFSPFINNLICRKVLTKVAWLFFDTTQPIADYLLANKDEVGHLFRRTQLASLLPQWSGNQDIRDILQNIAALLGETPVPRGSNSRSDQVSSHGTMS